MKSCYSGGVQGTSTNVKKLQHWLISANTDQSSWPVSWKLSKERKSRKENASRVLVLYRQLKTCTLPLDFFVSEWWGWRNAGVCEKGTVSTANGKRRQFLWTGAQISSQFWRSFFCASDVKCMWIELAYSGNDPQSKVCKDKVIVPKIVEVPHQHWKLPPRSLWHKQFNLRSLGLRLNTDAIWKIVHVAH